MDRLAMLQQMVATRPEEPFGHYGLAMELRKLERGEEARAAFDALMTQHPNYVPAYLMAGNLRRELGDEAGALETYDKGIEVAEAAGDDHTVGEIQAARAELG